MLTVNEIVAFWHACGEIGEPIGQLLKLLLLTGCRLNEVAAMTRAELSDDGATWTIPSSRTKNKRAHVVVSGAKAGVAGTYNRAAYANEKREALERWALHIERLVSSGEPDKVVNLHGHRHVSSQT